jgi:hypothetical protein
MPAPRSYGIPAGLSRTPPSSLGSARTHSGSARVHNVGVRRRWAYDHGMGRGSGADQTAAALARSTRSQSVRAEQTAESEVESLPWAERPETRDWLRALRRSSYADVGDLKANLPEGYDFDASHCRQSVPLWLVYSSEGRTQRFRITGDDVYIAGFDPYEHVYAHVHDLDSETLGDSGWVHYEYRRNTADDRDAQRLQRAAARLDQDSYDTMDSYAQTRAHADVRGYWDLHSTEEQELALSIAADELGVTTDNIEQHLLRERPYLAHDYIQRALNA